MSVLRFTSSFRTQIKLYPHLVVAGWCLRGLNLWWMNYKNWCIFDEDIALFVTKNWTLLTPVRSVQFLSKKCHIFVKNSSCELFTFTTFPELALLNLVGKNCFLIGLSHPIRCFIGRDISWIIMRIQILKSLTRGRGLFSYGVHIHFKPLVQLR